MSQEKYFKDWQISRHILVKWFQVKTDFLGTQEEKANYVWEGKSGWLQTSLQLYSTPEKSRLDVVREKSIVMGWIVFSEDFCVEVLITMSETDLIWRERLYISE